VSVPLHTLSGSAWWPCCCTRRIRGRRGVLPACLRLIYAVAGVPSLVPPVDHSLAVSPLAGQISSQRSRSWEVVGYGLPQCVSNGDEPDPLALVGWWRISNAALRVANWMPIRVCFDAPADAGRGSFNALRPSVAIGKSCDLPAFASLILTHFAASFARVLVANSRLSDASLENKVS